MSARAIKVTETDVEESRTLKNKDIGRWAIVDTGTYQIAENETEARLLAQEVNRQERIVRRWK